MPQPEPTTRPGVGTPRDPQAVREAIRRQVARDFLDGRLDAVRADTPLVSGGLIDSAGVVHLLDWLEERFDIEVDDADVTPENFDSVEALARLVCARKSA